MNRHILSYIFLLALVNTSLAQEAIYHFNSDEIIYKDLEYHGSLSRAVVQNQVKGSSQLNFNPVVSFNGTNDYLKVSTDFYSSLSQMTTITVLKPNMDTKIELAVWELSSNTPNTALSTTKVTNNATEIEYEGMETNKPVIHTYLQYYKKNNRYLPELLKQLSLGNETSKENAFNGQIAELLIFDKVLSEMELQKLTSSLAIKYGISLKEKQNYIASNETAVWDAQTDSLFNHRITGIGRDTKSGLAQKQSTSSEDPGFLTIGAEKIAPTNNDNIGTITDKHYLIWGDNNQPFAMENTVQTESAFPLTQRKWMINATGNSIEELNTQLKINATYILNDSISNLILVINEKGNDQFNGTYEGLRFIYPSAIEDTGLVTYNKVQWDKDRSGKDMFAFTTESQLNLPKLDENNNETRAGQSIHFGVYPNISDDGHYTVVMQFEKAQDVQIRIFDMAGKLYANKRLSGSRLYYLNDELIGASGMYNVVMNSGDIQIGRKLIVQ